MKGGGRWGGGMLFVTESLSRLRGISFFFSVEATRRKDSRFKIRSERR